MTTFPQELIGLANTAARMQTMNHNHAGYEFVADKAIKKFEAVAKKLGFRVDWPGLYPVLIDKTGRLIYMEN